MFSVYQKADDGLIFFFFFVRYSPLVFLSILFKSITAGGSAVPIGPAPYHGLRAPLTVHITPAGTPSERPCVGEGRLCPGDPLSAPYETLLTGDPP